MMRSSVGTVALLFLCLLLFGGQCGAVDRSQVAATPPPTHTNLGQAGTPSPTLIPEPTVTALSLSHPIAVVGEGEVAGNRDIFLIHADETQTVKQLTNRPWDDFSPSWLTWSPDGTRLAFASSQEDTPTNIYVIDADGSNLVQITQNGAVRSAWSPAGDYIAFSHRVEERGHVAIVRPDGTDQTNVLTTTEGIESLAWSPDGTHLAVVTRNGSYHTQVVDLHGVIEADIPGLRQPSWTPDGTRLVGSTSDGVAIVNADGTDLTYLGETPFRADYPLVSPDGTRLAFINGEWEVWVADLDGSNRRKVGISGGEVYQRHLIWSPDGTQLAYIVMPPPFSSGSPHVSIANADGSGSQSLNISVGRVPAWQPLPPASSQSEGIYLPLIQAGSVGQGEGEVDGTTFLFDAATGTFVGE